MLNDPTQLRQFLAQILDPQTLSMALTSRLPPSKTCEECGETIPVGHDGINHIMSVNHIIGSPGDPGVPPWQCHKGEHWACSPECWQKLAHKCIDEHMMPTLIAIHERLNGNGNGSNPL